MIEGLSIDSFFGQQKAEYRRLHLGCGSKYLEGYCNVDYYPKHESDTHRGNVSRVDVWGDILNLECSESSIDLIRLEHTFEHFYRHEGLKFLKYALKVLSPGGVLVIETPDFIRVILLSLILPCRPNQTGSGANRDLIRSQFYGASWETNSDGYPYHKYLWAKGELSDSAELIGFESRLKTNATLSHLPGRDMALILVRPGGNAKSEILQNEVLKWYGHPARRAWKQSRRLIGVSLRGFRERKLQRGQSYL